MESLTKDFKKIEMDVARYIFKKYISIQLTTSSNVSRNTSSNAATADTTPSNGNPGSTEIDLELGIDPNSDKQDSSDTEDHEINESNKSNKSKQPTALNAHNIDEYIERGICNKQAYKNYLKTIFHNDRKIGVINQFTELKKDLDDMAKADSAYSRNADKFNPQLYESLPDVMRCTYIRKHNHRYYRCKNKIANDDSDVCKKHLESENIYYDTYNDLVEIVTNT